MNAFVPVRCRGKGIAMNKRRCRPSKKIIDARKKKRNSAQYDLRATQKNAGLIAPPSVTISNGKCQHKNVEEEKAARIDAVSHQIKVYRIMLPVLLKRLSKIKDPRNPKKLKHKMTVLMLYGILCFAFQMESRREANREMTRPMFMANLNRLFPELDNLPHHDTLARILDQIDVSEIEQANIEMIRHLIRSKKFTRYLIAGCYPIAIDGTQKFIRAQLWNHECLERKVKTKNKKDNTQESEEKKQYYVYVLEANLAFMNGMVIPLLSEVLSYTEGDNDKNKQDCEQRAFRRLAKRLKKYFSHLSIMVLLDGLYPNGPVIELCRKNKWDFMIVLQDKSLPTVWEDINGLKDQQTENCFHQKWGKRNQYFWWVNNIDYRYTCPVSKKEKQQMLHVVICEEKWHEIAADSDKKVEKQSRHVWISELPLCRRSVHERCNLGARHRWGIESSILVEKHQGYQYEHCFSYQWDVMRGYHYLMRLGHALNVLACHSYVLAKYVRDLGVRGLIAFVRNTIASPWIDADELRKIAATPCQLKLE